MSTFLQSFGAEDGPTRERVLEVDGLTTRFFTRAGVVHAVEDVSFLLHRGEALGIVGESGCGKSVTALSLMRLVPNPPGRIIAGQALLHSSEQTQNLFELSELEMRRVRGNRISMIFQDPMTSLNPVLSVGFQIMEPLMVHKGLSKTQARESSIEMLNRVGIPAAKKRLNDYPHQFSGGMRQRVMIAMALACNPELLIADEPTTALDVTIQAQILDSLMSLNCQLGTAVILITHDLGVVSELCHRVIVMYAGRIVESGDADSIFDSPRHPYTVGLMHSVPRLGPSVKDRLVPIEGIPPDLVAVPRGCSFRPRCTAADSRCSENPPAAQVGPTHYCTCWQES